MTAIDGGPESWTQYRSALQTVIDRGVWADAPQGLRALTAMQVNMRFPIADGFPMITERSVKPFWRKPIGELCGFINGATTISELEEFGCDWWSGWTSAEKSGGNGLATGDIGPGWYGAAFHSFPTPDGGSFDQFAVLVDQLRTRPGRRTHFVSPWIPFYQFPGAGLGRQTTVSPCHGWVHVRVLNSELHLHMFQRSGDLPVGVPSNMIQYGALLLMLSQLTGYPAGTYYHTISDAHIYEDQFEAVELMLSRDVRPLPMVSLTEHGGRISDIHAFRAEDFDVSGYERHPGIRIPVAV